MKSVFRVACAKEEIYIRLLATGTGTAQINTARMLFRYLPFDVSDIYLLMLVLGLPKILFNTSTDRLSFESADGFSSDNCLVRFHKKTKMIEICSMRKT